MNEWIYFPLRPLCSYSVFTYTSETAGARTRRELSRAYIIISSNDQKRTFSYFSVEKATRPQTCEYLQRVYDIVWNIGAYDTLEDLFMASEDLVRGQILYEKLVQVLSIEKQELLRKMELVTFFTDNEQWVMDSFKKVLGKTEQDFENFENLVDKSFSGISASSDVNCYDYPSCWEAFKTFFRLVNIPSSP